jgi:hypothetical protein
MSYFQYFSTFPNLYLVITRFFLPSTNQSPDYCVFDFTPGQMVRMIAEVKQEKDYIYCNYANIKDDTKCASIPCASTATSPNCVNGATPQPTSHPISRQPTSRQPMYSISLSPTTKSPTTKSPTTKSPTTASPTGKKKKKKASPTKKGPKTSKTEKEMGGIFE